MEVAANGFERVELAGELFRCETSLLEHWLDRFLRELALLVRLLAANRERPEVVLEPLFELLVHSQLELSHGLDVLLQQLQVNESALCRLLPFLHLLHFDHRSLVLLLCHSSLRWHCAFAQTFFFQTIETRGFYILA